MQRLGILILVLSYLNGAVNMGQNSSRPRIIFSKVLVRKTTDRDTFFTSACMYEIPVIYINAHMGYPASFLRSEKYQVSCLQLVNRHIRSFLRLQERVSFEVYAI